MSSIPTTTALIPYLSKQHALYRAKNSLRKKDRAEKNDPTLKAPSTTQSIITGSGAAITIPLPERMSDLYEKVLFPLQRHIENQYQALPWPEHMKKILVVTQVVGGIGDIAAAAKAISLMQRICPSDVSYDWVCDAPRRYDPLSFLTPKEISKVHHRGLGSLPIEKDPADLLLYGPIPTWSKKYMTNVAGRKVAGPTYGFSEIAINNPNPREANFQLYKVIFPSKCDSSEKCLPMGIVPGSGVFLDPNRIQAPLSLSYCCPSYLLGIQDAGVRKDILEAMQIYDDSTTPDFNRYSFNSGYAHFTSSWGKFIDCVAMHESEKHVVVVLNHQGNDNLLSAEEFYDQVFTPERLVLLQKKGYGALTLKSAERETALLLTEDRQNRRTITVIVREYFTPHDIKQLQLASERLLTTGDNSAIESWSAKCKLYLYETHQHKIRFYKQQVTLATKIAPALARFLDLRDQNTIEFQEALDDPDLAKDTLKFCKYIAENCSFDPLFEAAIKRTAWHHTLPALQSIEEETIDNDKELRGTLTEYAETRKTETLSKKSITISTLHLLKERVHKTVEEHLTKTTKS